MRPISLTIEGLTAFRTRQDVDFSQLDLFVITGPTGSGKTTILDAITFALYGRMARIDQHGRRDLISHGSAAARVQLDFEVDGARYRVARRMAKQGGAQRGSLDLIDGDALRPLVESTRVRELNERVREIVGLDFETFTRAVLLPQGKFADFLSGDVAERRRILVQLLDLGRYERAAFIARQRASEIDARLGERATLLDTNYGQATAECLKSAKAEAKAAKGRLEALQLTTKQSRNHQRTAAALGAQIDSVGRASDLLGATREALGVLAKRWPELEEADRQTKKATAEALSAKLAADKTAATATQKLKETTERLGDSATLARLEQAAMTVTSEQNTLTSLGAELEALTERAKVAQQKAKEAKGAATAAAAGAKAAQHELEAANEQEQTASRLLKLAELTAERDRLAAAGRVAEASAEEATTRRQKAEQEQVHLGEQHLAVAIRRGLRVGDPCPVCQAPVRQVPSTDSDVEILLEKAKMAAGAAKSEERSTQATLSETRAELRSCEKSLKDVSRPLDEASVPTRAKAKTDHKSAAKLAQVAKVKQVGADKAERDAATASSEAASDAAVAAQKVSGCQTRFLDAESRSASATKALVDGLGAKRAAGAVEEIERRKALLAGAQAAATEAMDTASLAQTAQNTADQSSHEAERHIAGFAADAAAATADAKSQCNALGEALKASIALPSKVQGHGAAVIEWQRACDKNLASAAALIASLREERKTAVANVEALLDGIGLPRAHTIDQMLLSLEGAVTEASHQDGVAKSGVASLTQRIAERQQLEQSIGEDRIEHGLYARLGRDLAQNRFMQWLIDESLQILAAQASVELRLISSDRYSLDSVNGEFEVVDHANADERRSVSTLSGGETFLASLSLALALSVGLRELAGVTASRLDAMFIDEGFGQLDEETLGVVVDALERLREGDRMVGVITHVPTLATRITSGLSVEPVGSSSRISLR